MKQKLIFVLSLVAMAWSSAVYATERVAPTLPTELETPEDGGTYYLYNTKANVFLGERAKANNYGEKVTIYLEGSKYKIQKKSSDIYLSRWPDSFLGGGRWADICDFDNSSYNDWEIVLANNETDYYIRDTENSYMGYNNGEEYLFFNLGTESDVEWRFVSETYVSQYEMYIARVHLYEVLNAADNYGFDLTKYEDIYNNSNSTINEIENAINAAALTFQFSNSIAKHELNDHPIALYGEGWKIGHPYNSGTDGIYQYIDVGGIAELDGTVNFTTPSVLYFMVYGSNSCIDSELYVDGDLVRYYSGAMNDKTHYNGYYYPLSVGAHSIVWKFKHNGRSQSPQPVDFQKIGIISVPQISVNLLEPGSLGTEVLYNVDRIQDVRSLKIKGKMNNEDWAKLYMMTNLMSLDLSEVEMTSLPDNAFGYRESSWLRARFDELNVLKLPSQLVSIGEYALTNSRIEDLDIPSTVTTIGEYAFSDSYIRNLNLANVTNIPEYICADCPLLGNITLSDRLVSVGRGAFSRDFSIIPQTIKFPSTFTTAGEDAFQGCSNLNFRFPANNLELGREAFYGTAIDSLILKKGVTDSDWSAFYELSKLVYVELPANVWTINTSTFLNRGCPNLNTIVLKSATVVRQKGEQPNISNVTIKVPSFLVNSYKLDSYWYNAKAIEGFNTGEIQDWTINQPLVLNARDRFEGNPNITIIGANDRLPSLKINGDAPQEINDLYFYGNRKNYVNYPGQILSNSNYVKVNGNVRTDLETDEKRWFFFSLPFDVKVSDITPANGAQYAIRYYDGANRAANGASGSWKNYKADDIIPAGTGFIYQTNISTWSGFPAVDNESKQNVVSYKEAKLTLQVNPSENTANRGWNLIGNPYQCYYNNHMLNFTAPITVWDAGNKTYTAYSLTDDDYAIRPNEAFFVQCPNEELNTISFPLQGRQLNAVIESQNAANVRAVEGATTRQLIDLEVSNGELSDKTRVVVNEKATLGYDMGSDASKFMSADAPQIYTIGEDGTEYAINERPKDEGEVQLGFYTQKSGAFTLSMPRCQAKKVYLVDEFEHLTVDLTAQDYGFTAAEGKQEARFRLVVEVENGEATGIESLSSTLTKGERTYNLNGQRVGNDYKGIVIRNGKKYLSK